MTAVASGADRDVIPRWRSVSNTLAAGEFPARAGPIPLTDSDLDELAARRAEWEHGQSEAFAADFVATAVVLGVHGEAKDAIDFLFAASGAGPLRGLAVAARRPGADDQQLHLPDSTVAFDTQRARRGVANARRAIRRDPRQAIAWVEMARHYTTLGQFDQARRAVHNAVHLAPSSRFVLRVAACFHVMAEEPDRGHRLLVNAGARESGDPWLVAAELATASAAGRDPTSVRVARSILDDANFGPLDISEVASGLATLELRSGSSRRSRQLFQRSLERATENSVAQAEWASRRASGVVVGESNLSAPAANEARARRAQELGEWKESCDNAAIWLGDQPFSVEAAVTASFTAAVGLRDCTAGVRFAEVGLRAHPGAATLRNNAAFALVELGNFERAEAHLARVDFARAERRDQVAVLATTGLLQFRRGELFEGRRLYREAVTMARSAGLREMEAMAAVMFAREEVRVVAADWKDAVEAAERLAERTNDAAVRMWFCILQDNLRVELE